LNISIPPTIHANKGEEIHDAYAIDFRSYQSGPAPVVERRRDGNCSVGKPQRALHARRPFTNIKEKTMTTATEARTARTVDMKLEVVVIPVSDVDRAKRFYAGLGWRLDADFAAGDDFRVIQFTPPGSGCSVIFGKNVTAAAPGSAQGLYLIVSDIKAARDELLGRGVEISEVFHGASDVYAGTDEPYLFGRHRVIGPDPDQRSYRSLASFKDPDGNGWLFQEVTERLPGRVDADDTTFTSSTELATALRRAAAAHGEHEKRIGKHDEDWPDWYADYIVREQAGKPLPS
jgi:catechol 2,3-dioxygenase-like lactoylglutathione lyase family enzyme